MLNKIRALLAQLDTNAAPNEHDLQLASAALLIEISKSDRHRDEREQSAIINAIRTTFHLDETTLTELIEQAENASNSAPSLYDFTSVINAHCSEDDKYKLVKECWRVAFADGHLDKYEDHTIRKIAELIYLPNSLRVKAKEEVKNHLKLIE